MNVLNSKNQNPTEYIRELEKELEKQQSEIRELKNQVDFLTTQMMLARRKKYGASSEKSGYDGQMTLEECFNEVEKEAEKPVKEPEIVEVKGHKRIKSKGAKAEKLANLPVETIEYFLNEEDQACPTCGEDLHIMGKEVRKEIKIIPAQVKVVEHVKYIYACRSCERYGDSVPVVKASIPEPVIKGSIASPSAVAYIMGWKYVNGVPIYRQEQELMRMGIPLSRQTMSNWVIRCATDWLSILYEALHGELCKRDVIHADESVLQVLKEPGKKATSHSYMWLYRTSGCDEEKSIVLYEYQPDRTAKRPKNFLKGYRGYIHTDGYAAYHSLGNEVIIVGCLAHARRKFDEALKSIPGKEQVGSQAKVGKTFCDQLFALERELADYTAEERYLKRLEKAEPILDDFLAWLKNCKALPKSLLGQAVNYTLGQWKYLKNYLLDGRLEISNNRAERSIKPFVIGRKNFLFCDTPKGARASAIIYSIVETAKENGLNAVAYIKYLLEELPQIDTREVAEQIERFLPWNVPEHCRMPKDA